jgi:hypothetical protein
MSEPQVIDTGALTELRELVNDPLAVARRLLELADAAQQKISKIGAAVDRLVETRAAFDAHAAERDRELSRREAAVAERERQVAAETLRIIERERWVENRAADLTNRLHSVGA